MVVDLKSAISLNHRSPLSKHLKNVQRSLRGIPPAGKGDRSPEQPETADALSRDWRADRLHSGGDWNQGMETICSFWLRSFDELGLSTLNTRIWPPVDDPSWEIDPTLAPQPGELVINKRSAGAFATTDLEEQLRARNVENVVVTGVATDVCVSTTAREAADRNFKTVVVSDACTTISEQLHDANLQTLHVFGWVRTADEVVNLIQSSQAASA